MSLRVGVRLCARPLRRATLVRPGLRWYSDDPIARYREKLEQRAKQEGVTSIEDLKAKMHEQIELKKKEFNKIDPLKMLEDLGKSHEATVDPTERKPFTAPAPLPEGDIKELSSFIDVEKVSLHDRREIELLWKARFAAKERTLCGALDGVTFSNIYRNARKAPTFVLPLPHENEGIELHFVQWSFAGPYTVHCMITTLAEYKLHQDFARPHTTLIFHSDLLADKGVALMNGSVERDASITLDEAILLSLHLQRFYSAKVGSAAPEGARRKLALLYGFNTGDSSFSVDALISETETLD